MDVIGLEGAAVAWTLMVYLDGDNNLDGWTVNVFNMLEYAADNENVNIVVLRDRSKSILHDSKSYYYEVQHDTNLNSLADYTDNVNRWGKNELNLGDSNTLSDFITWSRGRYPASYYGLVLNDPGTGLRGGMIDETDKHSSGSDEWLSLSKMRDALDRVAKNDKIDVLFVWACLMGMIEDAYQFRALHRVLRGEREHLVRKQGRHAL